MNNIKKLILATLFTGLAGSAFAQNVVIHQDNDRNHRGNERIVVRPAPAFNYDRQYFRREHDKVDRMLRHHRISRQEAFRMHQRLERQERQQRHHR